MNVTKKYLLIVQLVLLTLVSVGQINKQGLPLPLLRNFSPEEYDASDQNWCAVQDHRGIMYFGNNDRGVLEYDGKTWRKIPVPKNATVRSLAVDSIGTVYVGTSGDFGYLAPNLLGKLEYKSLLPLLTDSVGHFSDVNKIYQFRGDIYFHNRNYLFIYDGEKVSVKGLNQGQRYYNLLSFTVNNRYYIGSYSAGLRELVDTSIIVAKNGNFFAHSDIWSMLTYNDSTATVVTNKGLFHYNQNSGEVKKLKHNDSFYGKLMDQELQAYHATIVNDTTLGVNFLFDEYYGFVQLDKEGTPIEILSEYNGLLDGSVLYSYQQGAKGNSGPLWLGLNVGIAQVDIHSPIRKFSKESGLVGGITGVTRFNGTLFVFTMSGVFYQEVDFRGTSRFKQLSQINSAAWSHLIFKEPKTNKEKLLVGTISNGIFEIDDRFRVRSISNTSEFKDKIVHIAYSLHQSKKNPNRVYIGMSGSFAAMEWNGYAWKDLGRIKRDILKKEYRSIGEVSLNDLWIVTNSDGITRVQLDKDTLVTEYGVEQGLPSNKNLSMFIADGKIYFLTSGGIYHFNESTDSIEVAKLPGMSYAVDDKGVGRVVSYDNGYAMACSDGKGQGWIELHGKTNGTPGIISKPFKVIPSRWSDYLYADGDILWVVISAELYSYNRKVNQNFDVPYNALIRRVTTKGDSVLFEGAYVKFLENGELATCLTQNDKQIYSLSFKYNSITFDVSSSFYESVEKTEYSYLLDGNEEEWSKWTTTPTPIYTNLSEGHYTFKVKARNVFGVESEIAEYSFSVSPPWYRSMVAIIGYVILLGLLVWGLVAYNTRRLIAEKIRLEQIVKERTAEVVAQKEELEHQRDTIFEQNEEIKSSINYASRIQNALLTPKEAIDEIFKDYFILFMPRDIVSGDFYWHTQIGNRKICVVADCTGHGVPGGFMSMLGIAFLTQITGKGEKFTASQMLDQLRTMIIASLHQTGKMGENKDGMDIAVYIIDTDTGLLEFAGANNPMLIVRDNELLQFKGDKMPIGIHIKYDTPFTNNVMEYKKGDVIYTFSDGYADQFGGPDQRKFMIKNLKELLLKIHHLPMEKQHELLHQRLVSWQGTTPRIDDIVIMGVRI